MPKRDPGLLLNNWTEKSSTSVNQVEVRLYGLEAGQRPSERVSVSIEGATRLGDLVGWLAKDLHIPDLISQIDEHRYSVIVNGINVRSGEMWETVVQPGAIVAIILPRAGG